MIDLDKRIVSMNGGKVITIIATDADSEFPLIGVYKANSGKVIPGVWNWDGESSEHCTKNIINLEPEPETVNVKRWMRVNDDSSITFTMYKPQTGPFYKLKAVKEIELEYYEGEGLDETT